MTLREAVEAVEKGYAVEVNHNGNWVRASATAVDMIDKTIFICGSERPSGWLHPVHLRLGCAVERLARLGMDE